MENAPGPSSLPTAAPTMSRICRSALMRSSTISKKQRRDLAIRSDSEGVFVAPPRLDQLALQGLKQLGKCHSEDSNNSRTNSALTGAGVERPVRSRPDRRSQTPPDEIDAPGARGTGQQSIVE